MSGGAVRSEFLPSAVLALTVGSVATAFLAVSAAFGSPLLALGLAVGVAVLGYLVMHPGAAAAVLVAVEASNVRNIIGPNGGIVLYVLVTVGICAILVGRRRGTVQLGWSPVFLFAGLYLASRSLSLLVARDLDAGLAAVGETAKLTVYLVVVTLLLSGLRRQLAIAKVLVCVIALLAGLSIVQEFVFGNSTTFWGFSQVPIGEDLGGTTARHSGPYGESDVVGWGKAQVLFLPIALSLWTYRAALHRRWLWGATALVILGGIYLTQSRGAYLALGLAVVVWLLTAGRTYARLLWFTPIVLLVGMLVPGVGSRLATLGALQEATGGGGGDVSLIERVAVQRDAIRMLTEYPILGVGPNNFLVLQPEYQRQSGVLETFSLPVHNSYLQIGAEGGIVGLTGWLLFYGCAAFVALRALILFRRLNAGAPGAGGWLAIGILGGLAGFALATLFVPLTQVRTLMSVLALAAALDIEARRAARARTGEPGWSVGPVEASPRRATRRGPLIGATAGFVTLLAGGLLLVPLREAPVWAAQATAQVLPRRLDRSPVNAYEYDVLSRGTVVSTYAGILEDPRFLRDPAAPDGEAQSVDAWVSVDTAPNAALITVSGFSWDPALAEHAAQVVLRQAQAYIDSLQEPYVLAAVATPPEPAQRDAPVRVSRVVALLGAAVALAAVVYWLLQRTHRNRRRHPPLPDRKG